MRMIDTRSLAPLGGIKRCPVCGGTDVRRLGVLRVCGTCTHAFRWRQAVRSQPIDLAGWVGGSDYDY
jgi:hypothetical protein